MKKILIIQTAFLGDVILATPVIERLHRCYPDAQIDFLLRKGNESLLSGHPHLHRVLVRDKRGIVLGAVGVTGDTSDNDAAAAEAGIAAAGFQAEA